MERKIKIFISGGNGMVGRNLQENLNENKKFEVHAPGREVLDLLDYESTVNYIGKYKPDVIIHCAGMVAGIQKNIEKPYSFLSVNTIIGFNLLNACIHNRIEKVINLGSSCMYPKNKSAKLKEEDILTGELEPTNEGYAISKIAVAKLCQYALKEHSVSYKTIIPCNLYGKYDSFDENNSHMIPAAIRKIHCANKKNEKPVIWGDGTVRREFMFVEDLVDFIAFAILNYDRLEPITNVGLGFDYSILEYYKAISEVIGYDGPFEKDLSKPRGMEKKLCSIEKQTNLGWGPRHTLQQGLLKTYKYYLEKYEL